MRQTVIARMNLLDQFILVSSVLTGYEQTTLHGTGMAEAYLAKLEKECGEAMTEEILGFGELAGELLSNDDTLAGVARALIKLWYLGQWCVGKPPVPAVFSESPNAYTQGLAWRAMGGHPQGAKQQGFGSWSFPPVGSEEELS